MTRKSRTSLPSESTLGAERRDAAAVGIGGGPFVMRIGYSEGDTGMAHPRYTRHIADNSPRAAIQIILQNGKLHKGDLAHSLKLTKNPARGAGDVRAPGAAQGSHR